MKKTETKRFRNVLTLCLRRLSDDLKKKRPFPSERVTVLGQRALNLYIKLSSNAINHFIREKKNGFKRECYGIFSLSLTFFFLWREIV